MKDEMEEEKKKQALEALICQVGQESGSGFMSLSASEEDTDVNLPL